MREVFYEESITDENRDKALKKFNFYKYTGVVFLTLGILFAIFIFMFAQVKYIYIPLILDAAIFAVGIIYYRKKNKFLVDFDYTFVTGSLRVAKIFNSKKRKGLISIESADIDTVGRYGSETYEKLSKTPSIKLIVATPNDAKEDSKDFFYISCTYKGDKTLVVLQCKETLIVNVLQFAGKSVLERNFQ